FEDMKRRTPDISKLRDLVGFEPTHTLADILRDVLADVQARPNGSASDSITPEDFTQFNVEA
ncbi:MAG: hypothetical protein ACLFTE_11305, partial [Salinivenus sp.]